MKENHFKKHRKKFPLRSLIYAGAWGIGDSPFFSTPSHLHMLCRQWGPGPFILWCVSSSHSEMKSQMSAGWIKAPPKPQCNFNGSAACWELRTFPADTHQIKTFIFNKVKGALKKIRMYTHTHMRWRHSAALRVYSTSHYQRHHCRSNGWNNQGYFPRTN